MIQTHSITRLELSRNAMTEERAMVNKLGSLKKQWTARYKNWRRNVMLKKNIRKEQKKLKG